MKRYFLLLLTFLSFVLPSTAVLKEKDLSRTLSVLRAELESNYKQQQGWMQLWQQQGIQQHQQLVSYMTQCEQISLMLYSQSSENTFDMAYACQQATSLYRDLGGSGKTLPYDLITSRLKSELQRLDELITALKSMPPVYDDETVLSQSDSILLSAIDSLAVAADSLRESGVDTMAVAPIRTFDDSPMKEEPLYLSGDQLEDRNQCVVYAEFVRDNLRRFLEGMEAESSYYDNVHEKVSRLNDFAQSRYQMLQDNIFRNGADNYFTILRNLPRHYTRAKNNVTNKYKPFDGKDMMYSEWRGMPVLFISIFVVFYMFLFNSLAYVFLRWLMPKRWKGPNFEYNRRILTNIIGIALFGIWVMIVRNTQDRNFIQMGTLLILNQCWLQLIIYLSLFFRLKGEHIEHGAKVYLPNIVVAFIIIIFRIVLIPNELVRLIMPPMLLAFALWQTFETRRHHDHLPVLDNIYAGITSAVMIVCTILSWSGFTFFAVQVLIWWTFQLAAIITVSCLHHVMNKLELHWVMGRINPEFMQRHKNGRSTDEELEQLKDEMADGKYITRTWAYDFLGLAVLPIIGVCSVLFCISWAAEVFDLTELCRSAFLYNFVDLTGVIQISIAKICIVAGLFFFFRWLCYTLRSFYIYYRTQFAKPGDTVNFTLARNVFAIAVWGSYAIISLIILKVPRSGLEVISAGLATGMGFAMKDLLQNFFYGISLMTGRVRVGDYIECDGVVGRVENIAYQSTMLDTLDGCVITMQNSDLFTKNFKNLTRTDEYHFLKLPVGVAYGTTMEDFRRAVIPAIMADARLNLNADGSPRPEDKPLLNPNKAVTVRFKDFGDSSVNLWVCVWSRVEEFPWLVPHWSEVVYKALNDAGIEIPFPQCDVHMKQQG